MIVQDLRGRVFGPLEFSRRDLMAINIQRLTIRASLISIFD
jgi:dual oxidase